MIQINLFKIQQERESVFLAHVRGLYGLMKESETEKFRFMFFFLPQGAAQEISWKWVFDVFELPVEKTTGFPKGIIIVQPKTNRFLYCISLGSAYFNINDFADKDLGLDYASRVKIEGTRLTVTANTTAQRNKTISSYKNFPHLEVASGESYLKIKCEIETAHAAEIIDDIVEVGVSIKFKLKDISLDTIGRLIDYVENTLHGPKINPIPFFKRVSKNETIDSLEKSLQEKFTDESAFLMLSEFDVVGTEEVFNRADAFRFRYGGICVDSPTFGREELMRFFADNDITTAEEMLKTRVGFCYDGIQKYSKPIHSLIDFMDETRNALLIAGDWYLFNNDYIMYLERSLDDIPVVYDRQYDITENTFEEFVSQKIDTERNLPEYAGMSEIDIRSKIGKKYYPERAFNLMRAAEGFEIIDRGIKVINGMPYELSDLRKGDEIVSVKRGVGSSDLCYVVTQSEGAVDIFSNRLTSEGKPRKVVLWLIFKRKNIFSYSDHKLAWSEVGMLLLKMRIDAWKKKVWNANMDPEIWINYEGLQ